MIVIRRVEGGPGRRKKKKKVKKKKQTTTSKRRGKKKVGKILDKVGHLTGEKRIELGTEQAFKR